MGIRRGSISTPIIADGLVFNMDAANRASYPAQRTFAMAESGSCYNTLDLTQSGSFISDPQFITQPVSASCWQFDGVDDYIDCSTNNLILGNVDFTIASWLNVGSHSTFGLAFFIGDGTTIESTWLGYCATAGAGSSNSIGGGLYGRNLGSGISSGTGWHYVTLTYDTTILRLYIDGVQKTTLSESSANITSDGIRFGKTDAGTEYWYNGDVGSTQVYNRALSANEVLHNYNALKSRFGL